MLFIEWLMLVKEVGALGSTLAMDSEERNRCFGRCEGPTCRALLDFLTASLMACLDGGPLLRFGTYFVKTWRGLLPDAVQLDCS